jgi:hypothetical protein
VLDRIETLLIGSGMKEGVDYLRESGRVKKSGRESVPDFVIIRHNLALEAKFTKDSNGKRQVITGINDDIQTYPDKYRSILFVVYDVRSIQDEEEFLRGWNSIPGVSVVVVKD